MSGVEVYECRNAGSHYFDVVWRGKRQWSVPFPWEPNKGVLQGVGLSLRYRADEEEKLEAAMNETTKWEAEQQRDNDDADECVIRDSKRTLVNKPQYYY